MDTNVIQNALNAYPTPFYLFDEGTLQQTIAHLASALPHNASLCYAMKANPFVVGQAAQHVARVEVCSTGEMRICQALNVPMGQIVVSGVHKDEDLMRELIEGPELPCRFTVESLLQYDLLERLGTQTKTCVPLLVRLTSGNQFGIDLADVRTLLSQAQQSEFVSVCGIQYFPGTQRTSEKRLRKELRLLDSLMGELCDTYADGRPDLELEFGPGLPVEYFEQDEAQARAQDDAQLTALGDAISSMDFSGSVVLEMGRAIAAACGAYATRVVDQKRNKGQNYAIVDGGMHQLVYFGHAMSLRQPACKILPERASDACEEPWNIYGSLCTTNDALAKQIPLADVHVGDVLVFERAGAYSMTEGISLFLSRDLPRVLMRDASGDVHLARDRFGTYTLNTPHAPSKA